MTYGPRQLEFTFSALAGAVARKWNSTDTYNHALTYPSNPVHLFHPNLPVSWCRESWNIWSAWDLL